MPAFIPKNKNILKYDLFCALGRQAVGAALKTLGQGHLGILLPEFICRDIPETCRKMGFSVHWYSVDRQLRPVGLASKPACRAILAVHYFGFPQDLKPFQTYCRRTGAQLIEDAAHSFLSKSPKGKALGSVGDFGISSFRKILPIANGAALSTKKPFQKNFIWPKQKRSFASEFWKFKKTLGTKSPWLFSRLRRLWHPLAELQSRLTLTCELQPPFPGLAVTLRKLSPRHEILRRQRAWKKFNRLGPKVGVRPVFSRLPANVCPYGYAFWGKPVNRILEIAAEKEGFSVISWPDLPPEIMGFAPKFYKDVRLVNFLKPCAN